MSVSEQWERIRVKQTVTQVEPMALDAPRKEGFTRFVAISDTHGMTDQLVLPKGDVLLHAGDFSNTGETSGVQKFNAFLERQRETFAHIVVIAGNHDLTFDLANYDRLKPRFHPNVTYDARATKAMLTACTYLEDESTTINGINIYGSPWQPEFCDWAFNLPRGKALRDVWERIPTDSDIVMTHGPPVGYGDECQGGHRAGCVDLLHTLQTRVRPAVHVSGHVHEGYGIRSDGHTTYINASTCNFRYRPIQPPIVFDLENKME